MGTSRATEANTDLSMHRWKKKDRKFVKREGMEIIQEEHLWAFERQIRERWKVDYVLLSFITV